MKIEDTVALGSVAAFAAATAQMVMDLISHYFIFQGKYMGYQISAGVYLHPQLTNDPLGVALGVIVWFFQAAMLGIILVYVLKITGRDFWWLKGLIVSNGIMFVWIYGFLLTLGARRIVPFDMRTNWTVLTSNIVFGLLTSYLIIRWGSEKVFTRR